MTLPASNNPARGKLVHLQYPIPALPFKPQPSPPPRCEEAGKTTSCIPLNLLLILYMPGWRHQLKACTGSGGTQARVGRITTKAQTQAETRYEKDQPPCIIDRTQRPALCDSSRTHAASSSGHPASGRNKRTGTADMDQRATANANQRAVRGIAVFAQRLRAYP